MTEWCDMAFIDYLNLVDNLLEERYGITSDDTSMDLIASSQECNESPEECVQWIADKYELISV